MATVTTTAGKPIDDNQFPIMPRAHGSGLPRAYQPIERLPRRKTVGKIATALAVAFSEFAFAATPASAARVGRAIIPKYQSCLSYDWGGSCSFTSYVRSAGFQPGCRVLWHTRGDDKDSTLGTLVLSKEDAFDGRAPSLYTKASPRRLRRRMVLAFAANSISLTKPAAAA
jgi:hypothetical protein